MSTPSGPGRRSTVAFSVFALLTLVAALLTTGAPSPAAAADADPAPGTVRQEKLHPELVAEMAETAAPESVEALVVVDARPNPATLRRSRVQVDTVLRHTAADSQEPVVRAVEDRGGTVVNSFWLNNMILVRAAPGTLRALTALDQVERIIPNLDVEIPPEPEGTAAPVTRQSGESTWGLRKIRADQVHDELGYTGDGVRIAVLDTGVDITHPDLAGSMVTDDPSDPSYPGGWIEFSSSGEPIRTEPYDSADHGTHVAGTALGGGDSGSRIGVAPDAELMAALVIPRGTGTFAQVIAGLQWAVAPVDADGEPAGEPADVVNLSLGGCGISQEMIVPTQNMRAAGVFPAFAIGNDVPDCFECGPFDSSSPGNVYESVGVGATGPDDSVADFSCGAELESSDWPAPPATWPASYVKPDVSAPGVDVESAKPGGGYQLKSGTSMATPHVAGAAALLFQARADLTVEDAVAALTRTAFFDDRHGTQRPNPRFGWGRIDVRDAITRAMLRSGVTGVVTDAETGDPVPGARITEPDSGTWIETDAEGRFEIPLPAGTYQLEISRFGYRSPTVGAEVAADEYTTVDTELTPAPRGRITGTTTFGPTGSALPGASVDVLDVPIDLSTTSGRHGTYAVDGVPVGTYRVRAAGPDGATSAAEEVTVSAAGPNDLDLSVARPPATGLASNSTGDAQGNGTSWWASLSADGQHVAFGSTATNLVAGDTNGQWDIFVRDRHSGRTERVSVASDGTEADDFSLSPELSADGRWVGFNSGATNLVTDDTNGHTDAFVHDRRTGSTERVSTAHDGGQPDDNSGAPTPSADGSVLVFGSDATNLVPGDTNGVHDIFVVDRETGTTERVSVNSDGAQGDDDSRDPSISADGRYIAFHSDATNLVTGDTNGYTDVFVHDRHTGTTERVPAPGDGPARSPQLSADGTAVAFDNPASRFGTPRLYVHELDTGVTDHVSVTHDGSPAGYAVRAPSLSADGNLVAFHGSADNIVEGDTNGEDDVFVRDRAARTTERITVTDDGAQADGGSALPVISADGRHVAFQSDATNLAPGDTNGQPDIAVHDRTPEMPTARLSLWDLDIAQDDVRPRQPVVVRARVTNVGDAANEYSAALRVDGDVEQTDTVTVPPGTTRFVRFKTNRTDPGDYTVAVGPLTGQFTVR